MQLYIVRHGESVANVHGVLPEPDTPLTKKGMRQAASIARYLAWTGIERVYTSPLERALQTAAIISAKTGAPVVETDGLSDMNYGLLAGRSYGKDEEARQALREFRDDPEFRFPEGESLSELEQRVRTALRSIRRSRKGKVAIVGHKDTNRIVVGRLAGRSVREDISEFEHPHDLCYVVDTRARTLYYVRPGIYTWW